MKKIRDNIIHDNRTLIGKSEGIKKICGIIDKIAPFNVNILVTGESGTGKELIAWAIYNKSLRKDKPFVIVNCAAIPNTLIESELFGHEKGAFTGADCQRKGKFELAHKGTLFLDEIGDMDFNGQAKILRIIEEKKFEKLGGEYSLSADTRIIAATNKDLLKKVKEGSFREDLYYRLNEVQIELPPLRKRIEDVPLLLDYFIGVFNKEFNKKVKGVSDITRQFLMQHNWPGNIRELKNVVKRAIALMETEIVWLDHLGFELILQSEEDNITKDNGLLSLQEMEKNHITKVLRNTNWNKSMSASILKISRHRLNRKIKSYNIQSSNSNYKKVLDNDKFSATS
ncbi:MAG: sigma-54 dependent transcriptional regulator [bacterium]